MEEAKIRIKFNWVNGYPVVNLELDNNPVYILLDSGSRECILDSSFYNDFGSKTEQTLPTEPLCSPSGKLDTTGKTHCNLTIDTYVFKVPVVLADIRKYLSQIEDGLDYPLVGILGNRLFSTYKMHIDFDSGTIYSCKPATITNKSSYDTLNSFQGKENVRHIVSDTGAESWLTQSRSFVDEAYAKGACKLNTINDQSRNVLFLFNSKDEEVGKYYLGKNLQDKTPEELVGMKDRLVIFESWNPKSKSWVPCVGINTSTTPRVLHKSSKNVPKCDITDCVIRKTSNIEPVLKIQKQDGSLLYYKSIRTFAEVDESSNEGFAMMRTNGDDPVKVV